MDQQPSVLFECVKNAGKAQMAAGLMRQIAGNTVRVHSAGTKPGDAINNPSAHKQPIRANPREVGVDITDEKPKPIDPQLLHDVDVVITLGREAHLDSTPGIRLERWDSDEPSERGIERMRLARDDTAARVADLYTRLQARSV